jgi:hypothetical protein
MKRDHFSFLSSRALVLFVAVIVSALAFGIQNTAVFADPGTATNTKNIQQTSSETGGTATGNAVAGPAMTMDQAQVHQLNIQVIAGDDATKANSTQTASNEANITQDDDAASGSATGSGAGTAQSGSALARSRALVLQLNIQVIAGVGCSVTQTASNVANIDQSAAAVSGTATASDAATAQSGDARATNSAAVVQKNVQVYKCSKPSTGSQTASNTADITQGTGAMSGSASASGGSSAASGDAAGANTQSQFQSNHQFSFN